MKNLFLIIAMLSFTIGMDAQHSKGILTLVQQGDSCMAEHDSQHAIGFINNISTHILATCLYYASWLLATECAATTRKPSPVWTAYPKTASTTRT